MGRRELKSNRPLTDILIRSRRPLFFSSSRNHRSLTRLSARGSSFICSLLDAHDFYLEPCLSCHDGASEGDRFPMTFRAAVRLLSSMDFVGIASRRSPLRRGAPVEASPQQRRRQQSCGEQWHSNGSGKGILATTAWHSPIAAPLAFFLLSFYILLHNREKDDASRLSDTIKLQRYNHQVVNSFSLSLSLSLCSCEDSQRNGDRANFYRL